MPGPVADSERGSPVDVVGVDRQGSLFSVVCKVRGGVSNEKDLLVESVQSETEACVAATLQLFSRLLPGSVRF